MTFGYVLRLMPLANAGRVTHFAHTRLMCAHNTGPRVKPFEP